MQILVLGMHRSGTSLTTRLINLMGAYVGPPAILLETNPANSRGFWERKDVMHHNDYLLALQEANWLQPLPFNPQQVSVPDPLRHAMQRTLDEMNRHTPWVMKDPRLCLTLPAWLPLLQQPVAVIASRHPLEAARSLTLRDGVPEHYALALWEYYTVATLHHAAPLPKVFSSYEALLASPVAETQRLCDALSENVPALGLPSAKVITDFINPSLKRATADDMATLLPHQQRLYAMICGLEDWDNSVRLSKEAHAILQIPLESLFSKTPKTAK